MRNRSRVEQSRRELVEHRLEAVVVVRVDDDDVDVGLLELSRSADAGEAAAENDDARTLAAVALFHRPSAQRSRVRNRMRLHPEGVIRRTGGSDAFTTPTRPAARSRSRDAAL